MVVDRDELVSYLDEYLEAHRAPDYGPNGLQVEGRREIRKMITGVSACQELFDHAVRAEADVILVHHGLLWDFLPRRITGMAYRRLATLIRHDINLLGYHLPLDRHPAVGNNAVAARALGLEDLAPFAEHQGFPVGFSGRFPTPVTVTELIHRATAFYGQEPLLQGCGPDPLNTVGVVSGAAQKELYLALDRGLDALVTGEVSEWVMNVAREGGIHYLACGHYATERCGVQALGEHVARRFGLAVEFVEVPNPV
jgi:dinuclear metal center YbgI/SA1388 family protein